MSLHTSTFPENWTNQFGGLLHSAGDGGKVEKPKVGLEGGNGVAIGSKRPGQLITDGDGKLTDSKRKKT